MIVWEPRGGCPSRSRLQRQLGDLPLSSPGTGPTPPPPRSPPPPARLAPPPPGRPSAHALSPRPVTWRFKSRRLARWGLRGGRARARRPRVTGARLGQVGARPPRSAGRVPARGGARRGRAPRRRVCCALGEGAARWPSRARALAPRVPGGVPGCGLPGRAPRPAAGGLRGPPRSRAFSLAEAGRAGGAGSPASPTDRAAGRAERGPSPEPRVWPTAGSAAARSGGLLPRQSFLWKVAFIFFPCLGFTGKGQGESPGRAQPWTWEPRKGPTAGTPRGPRARAACLGAVGGYEGGKGGWALSHVSPGAWFRAESRAAACAPS